MTDTFNNLPQKDISLDQVRELPAVFERVVDNQKSFNLAEAKKRLIALERELEASDMAIQEFQQSLAEKVIATGQVDNMDQSRGMILVAHRNELLAEQEILKGSVERANELQVAIGHLAMAGAMIASLDGRVVASKPIIGHFDVPVDKTIQSTASVVLEVPKPTLASQEIIEKIQQADFVPRFPPSILPDGLGRNTLKPVDAVKK